MDAKERTALECIGFAVLGNALLLLALFLLLAWRWGWRQAVRRIWEGTLVVSVYFGIVIGGMALFTPLNRWIILHSHYSARQIQEEDIRIERFIGKRAVVFSDGEERPLSPWRVVILAPLFLAWWLFDVWITLRIARRFAPSVWAEFTRNRNRGPIPPPGKALPQG